MLHLQTTATAENAIDWAQHIPAVIGLGGVVIGEQAAHLNEVNYEVEYLEYSVMPRHHESFAGIPGASSHFVGWEIYGE